MKMKKRILATTREISQYRIISSASTHSLLPVSCRPCPIRVWLLYKGSFAAPDRETVCCLLTLTTDYVTDTVVCRQYVFNLEPLPYYDKRNSQHRFLLLDLLASVYGTDQRTPQAMLADFRHSQRQAGPAHDLSLDNQGVSRAQEVCDIMCRLAHRVEIRKNVLPFQV